MTSSAAVCSKQHIHGERHPTCTRIMIKRHSAILLAVLLLGSAVSAQRPEVVIALNEPFFEALLDGVFKAAAPPEFPLATSRGSADCSESIKLVRDVGGVKTAVRFRDGQIVVPMAFSGNYSPPFVGCVPFSGYAESVIDLEFDQPSQRLLAKARVLNVNLDGTGGLGGSVIAKLVQGSIDKRINPLEILKLDKLSFAVPVHNAGKLNMRAVGIRHEVRDGVLLVHIAYEFT